VGAERGHVQRRATVAIAPVGVRLPGKQTLDLGGVAARGRGVQARVALPLGAARWRLGQPPGRGLGPGGHRTGRGQDEQQQERYRPRQHDE
jgi:hypothetical protein